MPDVDATKFAFAVAGRLEAMPGAMGTAMGGIFAAIVFGVPAMLGVTIGVALKRRVSTMMLRRGFAILLVAVAVALVVT